MKRIIYTFLIGMICMAKAISQPYNLTLNLPETGTQLHQATNSITFNPGYTYTSDGGNMIANIVSAITNDPKLIIAGTFSADFQYTDTEETSTYFTNINGREPNDVVYRFTLTKNMMVDMSHCGSILDNTYMSLLDSVGNLIESNQGSALCENQFHAFIRRKLTSGTYFVVSEGYSQNGSILTSISGLYSEYDYTEIPSAGSSDSRAVGAVSGLFAVSGTGGATYSVPIEVPVGVGGMQPSLAITYNSQSGNGVAGWGANLSGISAITRVPKSIYHDVLAKGLTYLGDDAYTLNGQRLIYSSGTVGQEGAIYYPESDPFTKVTAHGTYSSGNCNTWFEVMDKNGMKYYYGATGNGRQTYISGGVTRVNAWYLEQMEDPFGKYMSYEYIMSSYCPYLSAISYGNNMNLPANLSNRVELTYETRTDLVPFVLEGIKGEMNKRLKTITSKTGTTIFREYTLGYVKTDHFSRLISVTEKNGAGEVLKPTQLNWNYLPSFSQVCNLPTVDAANVYPPVAFADQYYQSADMNGDGITDLISVFPTVNTTENGIQDPTKATIYMGSLDANGNLEFIPGFAYVIAGKDFSFGDWSAQNSGCTPVDFDGDGIKELLIPNLYSMTPDPGKQLNISFIEGSMHGKSFVYDLKYSDKIPLYTTGDFNNDGKDEIFYMEKGQSNNQYPCQIVGYNGTSFYGGSFNLDLTSMPEKMFASDFNGDGLTDVMIFYDGGYKIFWNQGNGISSQTLSNSSVYSSTTLANNKMIRPGDFNGDGLMDFIMNDTGSTSTGNSNWYFALNNGNGTFTKYLACSIPVFDQNFTAYDDDKFDCQVFDFDLDGKSDVVIHKAMYDKHDDWFSDPWGVYRETLTYWMRSNGTTLSQVSYARSTNEADAYSKLLVAGDFNGDGKTELMNYGYNCYNGSSTTQTWRMYRNPGIVAGSGMLASVTSGYDLTTGISYAPLTQSSIYTKGSVASSYPVTDIQPALSAVKSVVYDNGVAGTVTENFKYSGAKVHMKGKGFLGFQSMTTTNTTTGVITEAGYNTLDLNWVAPSETYSKTTMDGKTALSTVKYTFVDKGAKKYFAYPNMKTDTDLDLNINTTTFLYNETYGYITEEKTVFGNPNMYKTTQYGSYTLAGGRYQPQLLTSISKHADDSQTFTQRTAFTYDPTKGYPLTKVENSGTPLALTTTFTLYDIFGNLWQFKVSGLGVPEIIYITQYDANYRFVSKKLTFPASAQTSYLYDTWGNVTSQTDETNPANLLTTTQTYNNWGQKTSTILSDGRKSIYQTGWNKDDVQKKHFTLTQAKGQPWIKTWYDAAGHETSSESIGPKGMKIETIKSYNTKGELTNTKSSQGDLTIVENFSYDARGRLKVQSTENGQSTAYTYGNRTVSAASNGNTTTKTVDAWGGIKTVDDPLSGKVTYTYKSLGKPWTVDANGAVTTMDYDEAGNQKMLTDPNAGIVSYTYDAAGRVKTQVDKKGNDFLAEYDALGRTIYSTLKGVRTDNTYGTTGFETNRLTKVQTGTNSVSYTYDGLGRPLTEKRQIDGAGQLDFAFSYTPEGQLQTTTYPGGLQVSREYDAYGNEVKVLTQGETVWQLTKATGKTTNTLRGGLVATKTTLDAQGKLQNLASWRAYIPGIPRISDFDYSFDALTGNLNYRTNKLTSLKETFHYDALDRLTSVGEGTTEVEKMAIGYEANGNISSKTGLGAFGYHPIKVHAVTSVDNTLNLIPATGQSISYNAFNKADCLKDTIGTDGYQLDIMYGPDQQRWKSVLKKNGTDIKTIIFAGDYEKFIDNGVTRELVYIGAGDGLAAVYVKQVGQAGRMYYAHKDHLGSIVSLTDSTNVAVFKASYDAWGKQTVSLNTIGFYRGYTGHEHLPEFGLINMNGRMYDPVLGRFLSPDNYVQAATNSQNYNRYSYCLNNPLIYSDPSGDFFWIPFAIGAIIGGYTGYKIADAKGYDLGDWQTYGYMVGGAAIGGFSGALGAEIATAGGFMANTSAMVFSSYSYSMGMAAMSGGVIQPSVNFGFGSFNFGTGEFNYLLDGNNKWYEDLGYGLGAIANVSDILKGFHTDDVQLQTENLTTASEKDNIGHSQLTDTKGNSLVDYGPGKGGEFYKFKTGRNNWTEYATDGRITQTKDIPGNIFNTPQTIKGVNLNILQKYSNWLDSKPGFYNFAVRSCSTQAARGLTLSGVPVFGIHPYLLRFQIANGLRTYMFNYTYTNGY
jgi:RHS repeat-associated protein